MIREKNTKLPLFLVIKQNLWHHLSFPLERTRQRGRPRKGWTEKVERDLQVLGMSRWRELVIDKEKWRGIVQQAKAHSGL
jgi:hypothetical protein